MTTTLAEYATFVIDQMSEDDKVRFTAMRDQWAEGLGLHLTGDEPFTISDLIQEIGHRLARDYTLEFDNGGGVTLYLGERLYAHHYDSADQAARDLRDYILGASPTDWEGDEPSRWDDESSPMCRYVSDVADISIYHGATEARVAEIILGVRA